MGLGESAAREDPLGRMAAKEDPLGRMVHQIRIRFVSNIVHRSCGLSSICITYAFSTRFALLLAVGK